MAVDIAFKFLIGLAASTAVVAPTSFLVSAGTLTSSKNIFYVNNERCIHFPIKRVETNNKLFVCEKKGSLNPIFKLQTTSGEMQEIETLSWNKQDGASGGAQNIQHLN